MICHQCRAENVETARFCESCGSPFVKSKPEGLSGLRTLDPEIERRPGLGEARSPFDLQPGHVFADRYSIIAEIGRGGMGVVYRAHDPVTERDVALKLIRGDRLAGKDAVKRLIREGVLARDIRHPNVVAVYDVGEVAGMPFLSMELLPGDSLRTWMQARMRKGEDCPMATAAAIVRELLAGLGAAHEQGVIHRDLKPENVVLLGEPGETGAKLKILDFGIARAAGGSETGSTSLGTLEYMSPEQITAPEAVQASADFYSLSVMFYELLIGVVPKGHWQPPSGGRSDVPVAIDRLIERGLSNSPRQRPQAAAQYREELEAALRPQATPQPKPSPQPSSRPQPAPMPVQPEASVKPAPAAAGGLFGMPGLTPARVAMIAGVAVVAIGVVVMVMKPGGSSAPAPSPAPVVTPQQPLTPPVQPVEPQPAPKVTQPPAPQAKQNGPPNPSNYSMLSGFWTDDFANYIQVRVSRAGEVSGQVMRGPLNGYSLLGQFDGVVMEYAVGTSLGVAAQSVGQWMDECHIQYALTDSFGQPTGQTSMIHVNHYPNDPCP